MAYSLFVFCGLVVTPVMAYERMLALYRGTIVQGRVTRVMDSLLALCTMLHIY